MNYKMWMIDQSSNEGFDISELVHNIQYTTTLYGQAGKLTFLVEKDPNNEFKMSLGSLVMFWCDDVPVFYGYAFKIGTDRTECYQVTAYDQMRYLQNHDYLLMEDMSLKQVFEKICAGTRIKNYKLLGKAKTATQKVNKKHFADASYFDMLTYAMQETSNFYVTERVYNDDGTFETMYDPSATEGVMQVKFFVRDNFGVLELNDIESNVKYRRTGIEGGMTRVWTGSEYYYYDESLLPQLEPLIIGDESLLTDYKYEIDIDTETYNDVYILNTKSDGKSEKTEVRKGEDERYLVTSDGKQLGITKQNTESIKKYGTLRRIANIKSPMTESQMESYAKLILDNYSTPKKTMKLEALGYNGVNAGDGFLLRLKKLNYEGMVYVISATHNYGSDIHTMSLEVCTAKNMAEVI